MSGVGRYRKKPVEIDAVQFKGSSTQASAIDRWIAGEEYVEPGVATRDITTVEIVTLEGTMTASMGDWIIRGLKGEFYPCKPDIFAASYDQVNETGFISARDAALSD